MSIDDIKRAIATLLLNRPTTSESAISKNWLWITLRDQGCNRTDFEDALYDMKDLGLIVIEEVADEIVPSSSPSIEDAPEGVFIFSSPRPERSKTYAVPYDVVRPLPALRGWRQKQSLRSEMGANGEIKATVNEPTDTDTTKTTPGEGVSKLDSGHGANKSPPHRNQGKRQKVLDSLLQFKTAGYTPSTELSCIIAAVNESQVDAPGAAGALQVVTSPLDEMRRPWIPILKQCLAKIPDLAENLTEEKLRVWLWQNCTVPPDQDPHIERLVSLLERNLHDAPKVQNGAEVGNQGVRTSETIETTDPDLTTTERAVLNIIKSQPKGTGIQGKAIIAALKKNGLTLEEKTLRRHHIPKLKKLCGVVNVPAAGGYHIPSSDE